MCLYVVVNILSFLSARDSVLHLFKKDDYIRDSIYNALVTVMLVNFTSVPLLTWIDTPKFMQYLHKWEKFQVGNNSVPTVQSQLKITKFYLPYFKSTRPKIRKMQNLNKFLISKQFTKVSKLNTLCLRNFFWNLELHIIYRCHYIMYNY